MNAEIEEREIEPEIEPEIKPEVEIEPSTPCTNSRNESSSENEASSVNVVKDIANLVPKDAIHGISKLQQNM